MRKVVFVADGVFYDYALFIRATAVAVESLGEGEILLSSLGNQSVQNMIIEYTDKTRPYLKEKKVVLKDAKEDGWQSKPTKDVVYVVVLNDLRFNNHKQYVAQARAEGAEIWSYDGR
jgi:hypothetical protein